LFARVALVSDKSSAFTIVTVHCERSKNFEVAVLATAQTNTTAFALAGLGGFNAHGAGFLAAAAECGVVPDMVTATSGQIAVVADWLQRKDLEKSLVVPALAHDALAQLAVLFSGDPGIFRPAYMEAIGRWFTPPPPKRHPLQVLFDRLLPAQLYVPTRRAADFATIADVFNNKARIGSREIGVVFNAYNLQTGEAVLFGNDKARSLWPDQKSNPHATKSARRHHGKSDTEELHLQPITAEAIEAALWLSLYGFEHLPQPRHIDGAYFRSCIVSELHTFDRIFIVRPLAQGWVGNAPSNYFDVQDWQTEMWFSVGYKAEVDALYQINGLIAAGKLGPPYKNVELIEIVPDTPAGYFHFFIERKSVYERAHKEAVAKFAALGLCAPSRA
jgi:hypothetical protein